MTIVVAQKRGDEGVLLSDTMIVDDYRQPGPDRIPGRLKCIVLSKNFTVAFAGAADQALGHIELAYRALAQSAPDEALSILRLATADGGVEFIVAEHRGPLTLYVFRRAGMVTVNDVCGIGSTEGFSQLLEHGLSHSVDSLLFSFAMQEAGAAGVGGLPIEVRLKRDNHHYVTDGMAMNWDIDQWGPPNDVGEIHAPLDRMKSGRDTFVLHRFGASGMPMCGAVIPQARTGIIYSPFLDRRGYGFSLLEPNLEWYGSERLMFDRFREIFSLETGRLKLALSAHS